MIAPFLVSVGILGLLYATRGPVRSVSPNRWYILGLKQPPGAPPADDAEIEASRKHGESLGFKNVTLNKITFEDNRRTYWFKGMWTGTPTAFRPDTPVTVYEVLGW